MKKIIFFIFLLLFVKGYSQILNPVKWTSFIEKKTETNSVLVFNGTIEKDWHVYSQFTPEGGSLPLEITFKDQKGNYELIGKAQESKTKTAFNDVFGVNETFFENKIQIKQEIKIINSKLTKVNVSFDFQACKDVCINLKKDFSFSILSNESAKSENTELANNQTNNVVKLENAPLPTEPTTKNKTETVSKEIKTKSTAERGLGMIFLISFLSGFAALLTPCVFPMIPMTVSFFTKQSKNKNAGIKNAFTYGVSIILIYVILGFIVTWIFGADALNALSTEVWFNVLFFVLLIVFATSFLGAFEILLPNSWANKVDSQADKGGVIGILFMALALAIVSFSCTGPIVGTLLVEAASRGGIAPIVGMFGFSLALALPFMLFAMFPGWLNSLPKSGGWLNNVKVVLGLLELAFAFKFLSNADLVMQTHLLEREVFLAIWIAIFGVMALYLFGKIKLPHDSVITHISVARLILGLIALSFTIYLIPGLFGAPLKLINAFPPPLEYSESPLGVGKNDFSTTPVSIPEGAKTGPHGITVFNDYDKGLAYAKSTNKPILLDFTGHACVNCRKMENNVWSENNILKILKNEVVLISLYVDSREKLPENEQFISKSTNEKIITKGDKWTDFMITKYKTNTQPLYVLTDWLGNELNFEQPTISYCNATEYKNWLKIGLEKFKQQTN